MSKYDSAEKELNKWAVPTSFHDMHLINMKFSNDSIEMKFSLSKYMDEFGILEDDNHVAILNVIYNNVTINNMNLEEIVNFRNSSVYSLEEKNGIISLNIYNDAFDFYFCMDFSCNKYKWTVQEVISEEEYDMYSNCYIKYVNEIIKIQEIGMPNWANFKK